MSFKHVGGLKGSQRVLGVFRVLRILKGHEVLNILHALRGAWSVKRTKVVEGSKGMERSGTRLHARTHGRMNGQTHGCTQGSFDSIDDFFVHLSPTSAADGDNVKEFYAKLQELVEQEPTGDVLIST